MDILLSIGLNETVAVLFVIFLVTFVFLNSVLFKPYYLAYVERTKKTVGNKGVADQTVEETKGLELEYEAKAKAINIEHKKIYDASKSEALKQYESIVDSARTKAQEILVKNRELISKEVQTASTQLTQEVPAIGNDIATKLLGKEVQ